MFQRIAKYTFVSAVIILVAGLGRISQPVAYGPIGKAFLTAWCISIVLLPALASIVSWRSLLWAAGSIATGVCLFFFSLLCVVCTSQMSPAPVAPQNHNGLAGTLGTFAVVMPVIALLLVCPSAFVVCAKVAGVVIRRRDVSSYFALNFGPQSSD